MSDQDKEEEKMFLDPGKIQENYEKKLRNEEEKRLEIIDVDRIEALDKKRFEKTIIKADSEDDEKELPSERTKITEIPPAKIRIEEKKRRDLSAKYQQVADEALAKKQRPQTGLPARPTSNLGVSSRAEMTTEAHTLSVFEETEGAIKEYPFEKFFSTNEPV
jgi:hypothetical protein